MKEPFLPIAGGTTVDRRQEDGWNVLLMRIDDPVEYYVVTAGRFHLDQAVEDGLTVRVATYGMKNERAFKTILPLAHTIIDFYESCLGPFPFDEFQIVEAADLGWGQAPPGMMIITSEVFNHWFHAPWSRGVNHRFAHEIAHQYWGHLIKWGAPEEQWLSESFAEVTASFAVKGLQGKPAFERLFDDWKTNAEVTGDLVPIAMANRLAGSTERSHMDRINLLYSKGPLALFELREAMGGQRFEQFLHAYVKAMSWRFGNTEHLVELLNQATGQDHSDIFERLYWGTKQPRVERPLKAAEGR